MKVTVIHGYLLFTPPDDDLTPFLFSGGGGSVNTGKYKGENWGDDDESQQDIRWIGFVCVFVVFFVFGYVFVFVFVRQ